MSDFKYEKDKLYIVFYINVGAYDTEDIPDFLDEVYERICPKDDTVQCFVIPMREGNDRIEVLPTFKEFNPLDEFNKVLNESAAPYYNEIKNKVFEYYSSKKQALNRVHETLEKKNK